jgi:hypothetical protein
MRCNNELGADLPSGGPSQTVRNLNELENAISHATHDWQQSGGTIILTGTIEINNDRTFDGLRPEHIESPVVIRPQSIGGATIRGDGELKFEDVRNVWLYGINFEYDPPTSGEDHAIVTFEKAAKCRIARCDFHTRYDNNEAIERQANEHYYLRIWSGRENENLEGKNLIDHNIFHHKPKSEGAFLLIGNRVSRNNIIEYNYFLEKPWRNGDNSEALRIGHSGDVGEQSFNAKVWYNLFEKCNADFECITNKSRDNIYSYNTFRNCIGSLTFRHGWNITADSNVFIECARGIRIFGKDNEIRNNYFKNVPSNNQDGNDSDLAPIVVGRGGGGYLQVEKCNIEGNLIEKVDGNARKIVTWRGTGDGRPEDVDFVNNKIIVRGGTIFSEMPNLTNEDRFENNKIFHTHDINVNLPNSAYDSQEVDSLELPEIIRPSPLQSNDVGPCSGLSEYTFSRVRETLE